MAIKLNVELQNGIKVDGAYIRVECPSLTKDSMSFNIRKYTNVNKQAFAAELILAPYTLDGANPFKQAYEYIKTLPEYADAEDC